MDYDLRFFASGPTELPPVAAKAGFRSGAKGTHTSRTMMLDDLVAVLATVPADAPRAGYTQAIIESNCLGKTTIATRRHSNQRLGELYAFDTQVPLFRVLRRIWDLDQAGRPLLALQCAVARDPLLAATATAILSLPAGAEFQRDQMRQALRSAVGDRLNDAILDKVMRNAASSWTQSGHLEGRTFKKRRLVQPTPGSLAYALYLGNLAGFRGLQLFSSGWITLLDCSLSCAQDLAFEAKKLGLLDLRISGDIVELKFDRLDRQG